MKHQFSALLLSEDMDPSIDAYKTLVSLLHGFTIMQTNQFICNSSGSKSNLMAAKHGKRVVYALNNLSFDGLCLPEEKIKALIEEYLFDNIVMMIAEVMKVIMNW